VDRKRFMRFRVKKPFSNFSSVLREREGLIKHKSKRENGKNRNRASFFPTGCAVKNPVCGRLTVITSVVSRRNKCRESKRK